MKWLLASFIIFIIIGWEAMWMVAGVKLIFPWQLKEWLAENPGEEQPLIVDVRNRWEYRLFHIPGARLSPQLLLSSGTLPDVDFDQPIVVVCMTGHRSPFAARQLETQGYKNVYHLSWGMIGWLISGGEIKRGFP